MPFPYVLPYLLGPALGPNGRTVFERLPGILSGRIKPQHWTAPVGEYVYCLGSDVPGYTGRFVNGDRTSSLNAGTVAADSIAHFTAHLRGAREMPPGWYWECFVYVPGTNPLGALFYVDAGAEYDMPDLAVPLMVADGPTGVEIILRLQGPVDEEVELEIPALYFDSFIVEPIPAGLGVFNRLPANGAVNIARDAKATFWLMSTTGTLPELGATSIDINGVAVMTLGAITPGWSVTTSQVGAGAIAFEVTPPDPWASEEHVVVHVTSTLGPIVIDETWSFDVVDETAPVVVSAISPSHDTVRVRFDEPVLQVDPTSGIDALNPANYAVTPLTVPAVELVVVNVVPVSPFEVDLVTDITITQGATYEVVVTSVEDVHGNAVEAPLNRAEFEGYECPVPAGRRFELWRMLSDMDRRRDTTRDLYKTMSVLQEPTDLLLCDIDRWVEIIDVDIAEERYVDQMLITLGNPFAFDLELVDKRRLVRSLIRVYQQKGTAIGIINVIRFFLGLEVTIDAYNQDGWILGEDELGFDTYLAASESFARYAFVVISPVVLTDEQRSRIDQLVEYMKPPHTHHIETTEPEAPPITTEFWDLGVSELGIDTILSGEEIGPVSTFLTVGGGDIVTVGGGDEVVFP